MCETRPRARVDRPGAAENEPAIEIDDTFAFDAAARFNEGVVANVDAVDTNLTVRILKKGLAVVAILFLLAGAVVVALARASGNVVH